jgi:hypothetical protein
MPSNFSVNNIEHIIFECHLYTLYVLGKSRVKIFPLPLKMLDSLVLRRSDAYSLKKFHTIGGLETVGNPGSICRDISAILKFNLAPVFLRKILCSISSKNSAYQA